jgi:transcription initiation factor TFIID TATA-box-binding protein
MMEIVNIVCSGSLNQEIKFNSLRKLDSFQYDPEMYHGAYLIINSKKVTLYKNGKYIFVGIKKIDDINAQFNQMKEILSPLLNTNKFGLPQIQNMVIIDQLPKAINLKNLSKKGIDDSFEYKAGRFARLMYKGKKGTVSIFSSGKMVFLGFKSIKDAEFTRAFIMKLIC